MNKLKKFFYLAAIPILLAIILGFFTDIKTVIIVLFSSSVSANKSSVLWSPLSTGGQQLSPSPIISSRSSSIANCLTVIASASVLPLNDLIAGAVPRIFIGCPTTCRLNMPPWSSPSPWQFMPSSDCPSGWVIRPSSSAQA